MSLTVINELRTVQHNKKITITLDTYRDVSSLDPFQKPEEYAIRFWMTFGVVERVIAEHKFPTYNEAYRAYIDMKALMEDAR